MNYFGFIDNIEENGNEVIVYFDSITVNTGLKLLKSKNKNNIGKIRTYRIVYKLSQKDPKLNYFTEGKWYHLKRRTKGKKVAVYKKLNSSIFTKTRILVTKLNDDSNLANDLADFFSLNHISDAEESEIINLLKSDHEPEFIGVYNVGQGNCNAICNTISVPLLYFDFGGGCAAHASTYPTKQRYCMTNSPPIILSHWDTDHWAAASKGRFTKANDCKWIVPRQSLGPNHLLFAHQIHLKGNLKIWPSRIAALTIPNIGIIFTCNGKRLNDSGLALLTTFKNMRVLLPGDADYRYIDPRYLTNLDGLIATHHGANISGKSFALPITPPNSKCAFSFGRKNSYDHPRLRSIRNHNRNGWLNRIYTPNGHIGIGTRVLPMLGCRKEFCDLQVAQI
ncbi:hypothetical protein OCE25_27690 [Bacillus cereus]|nr:hypothetical protein [Bacillus cereus]